MMDRLPDELLLLILSHVDEDNRLYTLIHVCRRFMNLVLDQSFFHRFMDLVLTQHVLAICRKHPCKPPQMKLHVESGNLEDGRNASFHDVLGHVKAFSCTADIYWGDYVHALSNDLQSVDVEAQDALTRFKDHPLMDTPHTPLLDTLDLTIEDIEQDKNWCQRTVLYFLTWADRCPQLHTLNMNLTGDEEMILFILDKFAHENGKRWHHMTQLRELHGPPYLLMELGLARRAGASLRVLDLLRSELVHVPSGAWRKLAKHCPNLTTIKGQVPNVTTLNFILSTWSSLEIGYFSQGSSFEADCNYLALLPKTLTALILPRLPFYDISWKQALKHDRLRTFIYPICAWIDSDLEVVQYVERYQGRTYFQRHVMLLTDQQYPYQFTLDAEDYKDDSYPSDDDDE